MFLKSSPYGGLFNEQQRGLSFCLTLLVLPMSQGLIIAEILRQYGYFRMTYFDCRIG